MIAHSSARAEEKEAQSKLDETFWQSNIAPQNPQLNRGYWLQLEHHVRKLARKHEGRTFVITGPMWIPTNTVAAEVPGAPANSSNKNNNNDTSAEALLSPIGGPPHQQLRVDVLGSGVGAPFLPVPTHFFKLVLLSPSSSSSAGVRDPSSLQLAAFLLPNTSVALSTPLRTYQVPVELIEHYAGWQFFPRLPRHAKRRTSSGVSALLPASFDSTPPMPLVRDLCAAGNCELKIKEFHFAHKHANKSAGAAEPNATAEMSA